MRKPRRLEAFIILVFIVALALATASAAEGVDAGSSDDLRVHTVQEHDRLQDSIEFKQKQIMLKELEQKLERLESGYDASMVLPPPAANAATSRPASAPRDSAGAKQAEGALSGERLKVVSIRGLGDDLRAVVTRGEVVTVVRKGDEIAGYGLVTGIGRDGVTVSRDGKETLLGFSGSTYLPGIPKEQDGSKGERERIKLDSAKAPMFE